MKITMLGVGCAMVTKCYNTCFVVSDGERRLLVDGGGGNTLLGRFEEAGIDWRTIEDVFVTHKHMDHLLGLLWFVRLVCQEISKGQYAGELRIYGHDEVVGLLESLSRELLPGKHAKHIGDRVRFIVVADGETAELIGRRTTFFDVRSTKAKQFGFSMTYASGKVLACCGDEPFNERNRAYVENSEWLLHEAFCLYSQRDEFKPYEKNHSTVKDACEVAQRLNVSNLVLYHTEERNLERRKELYLAEGRAYYRGNLLVPDDLESFDL